MGKYNKKTRRIQKILVMVLLCVTLLSIGVTSTSANIGDMGYFSNSSYETIWSTLKSNKGNTINLDYNILNPNKYAFCVENGINPYKGKYVISGEFTADDDYLAYILAANEGNLDDTNTANDDWDNNIYNRNFNTNIDYYKYKNIRQNLIWYYVYNKADKRTSPIYKYGARTESSWPSNKTLSKSEMESIWNGEIKNYVNRQKNFGIQITSLKENGNNVELIVNGVFDSYIVEYWYSETGKTGEWKKHGGEYINNTVRIEKSCFGDSKELRVRVKAKIEKYEASYIILRSSTAQDFLIRKGNKVTRTSPYADAITQNTDKIDVSLQKFINEVNDIPITSKNKYVEKYDINGDGALTKDDIELAFRLAAKTENDENAAKKADLDGDKNVTSDEARTLIHILTGFDEEKEKVIPENVLIYDRENSETSKESRKVSKNSLGNISADKDKMPVEIRPGDEVTYRVYVYNNGNQKTDYEIIDTFPIKAVLAEVYLNGNSYEGYTFYEMDGERARLGIKGSIDVGTTLYYDIKLKFDEENEYEAGKIYENKVELKVTNNQTEYRTVDYDFVKVVKVVKQYAVSLEKFISKRNDEKVTYNIDFGSDGSMGENKKHDRSGRRYNDTASTPENKDPWKKDNPVRTFSGDEITFTIRLKNTGEQNVKVTKIYDTFTNSIAGNFKGTKLELLSVSGNGEPTAEKVSDGLYYINFKDAEELEPNESVDVYIKFNVTRVNSTNSTEGKELFNQAGILQIADSKNNIIAYDVAGKGYPLLEEVDADGVDNNHDMDFLRLDVKDNVSIQKYIYKINDNIVQSSRANAKYSTNINAEGDDPISVGRNCKDFNKKDNPLEIKRGDEVQYEIIVYNNNPDNYASGIKIVDRLYDYIGNYSIVKIEKGSRVSPKDITDEIEIKEANDGQRRFLLFI